ncbi:MAG: glycosyltransferase family 2 protein [Firmicutes bacterium]|nr:glycosyltransferase family 2 protein [Bacillota bacterium]
MLTSVIIPAYNETELIASTIEASIKSSPGLYEIIVIDDCSSDDTFQKAQTAGALVFKMPKRAGKGAALMQGVLSCKGDIVVFLDADLGETATETPKLIKPVITGQTDMAVARFPQFPLARRKGLGLVKLAAYYGVWQLCKQRMDSILSGQRAAKRSTFLKLMPFAPGFGVEVGLTIDALRRGLRILEVDCNMAHRITGWDFTGVSHRARQFYWVVGAILTRYVN